MCVYVFAIFRTFRATELKLGTELEFHLEKDIAIMRAGPTHPGGGAWGPKSGSQVPHSQNGAFLGQLYKTKVEECPRFSGGKSGQIRSRTSPWGQAADPSTRGGSAAVVQLDEVVDLT